MGDACKIIKGRCTSKTSPNDCSVVTIKLAPRVRDIGHDECCCVYRVARERLMLMQAYLRAWKVRRKPRLHQEANLPSPRPLPWNSFRGIGQSRTSFKCG